MYKQKNIQIPENVFNDIIELLFYLGDPVCLRNAKLEALYKKVDSAVRQKRISMLNRQTYAEIIHAKDDDSKESAHKNYLATKQFYSRNM